MTRSSSEEAAGPPLDDDDQARLAEAVSHIEGRVVIQPDAEPYLIEMSARRLLPQRRG